MNKGLVFVLMIICSSCSYGEQKIQGYIENPRTILEDPASVQHEQALADLESSYLRKEITYAEYLQKKQGLEDHYAREIQKREPQPME